MNVDARQWYEMAIAADLAVRDGETVFSGIFDEEDRKTAKRDMEPLLRIQKIFGLFGPQPPKEIFTTQLPPIKIDIENDPIPIDGVLGLYVPSTREIWIYVEMIREVAQHLRISPDDLQFKVRLHEYAHAMVHLGIEPWEQFFDQPPSFSADEYGDWEGFLKSRLDLFCNKIDDTFHELLAQSFAWCLLDGDEPRRHTFVKLMGRQPEHYHLSEAYRDNISIRGLRRLLGMLHRTISSELLLGGTTHPAQMIRSLVEGGSPLF